MFAASFGEIKMNILSFYSLCHITIIYLAQFTHIFQSASWSVHITFKWVSEYFFKGTSAHKGYFSDLQWCEYCDKSVKSAFKRASVQLSHNYEYQFYTISSIGCNTAKILQHLRVSDNVSEKAMFQQNLNVTTQRDMYILPAEQL